MMQMFAMSGYGMYVWTSVGLACVALSILSWHAHLNFKRAQKAVAWSKHAQH